MTTTAGPTAGQWAYSFARGRADLPTDPIDGLGITGAALAKCAAADLAVPSGFTLDGSLSEHVERRAVVWPEGAKAAIETALVALGEAESSRFGDIDRPLLVVVRASTRRAVPGLYRGVLSVGLSRDGVPGLGARLSDQGIAWECYAKLIESFGTEVCGLMRDGFEAVAADIGWLTDWPLDLPGDPERARRLADAYLRVFEEETGEPFPDDPQQQLWRSIEAALAGWRSSRAARSRRIHRIPDSWKLSVTVQAMTFGLLDASSGLGRFSTHDAETGVAGLSGLFLPRAQGEDLRAPTRVPERLAAGDDDNALARRDPTLFARLRTVADEVQRVFVDACEFDVVVEQGTPWIIDVRSARRSGRASVRIGVDLAKSGLITEAEALLRIDPKAVETLLHPVFDSAADPLVVTKGLPASPGAASGLAVFSSAEAERLASAGHRVILVREETGPNDVAAQIAAVGVLTARGGMTSHAAVVARGLGKPCVCGAEGLRINEEDEEAEVGEYRVRAGEAISIDGSTGQVVFGAVDTRDPLPGEELATLLGWADTYKRMAVRANADTVRDATVAVRFGAAGIGLCRTEHTFLSEDRLVEMRRLIVADTVAARHSALATLLSRQRADFAALFEIMAGKPLTIRLLDPPLHEFLPRSESEIEHVSRAAGISISKVRRRVRELTEVNPMLGHRGCRLGISFPEIYEMQSRAIFEAALQTKQASGRAVPTEIMVPLIGTVRELAWLRRRIVAVAEAVMAEMGERLDYKIGTMIELPRACLRAADIADESEFFSFGTNDLTQTAFGISRDDAPRFLQAYRQQSIFEDDPFATLDQRGVGELISIAVERGRARQPGLTLGVCGEHGADPDSVQFFERLGLDYISCSPFRVPVAVLAAAQARLLEDGRAGDGGLFGGGGRLQQQEDEALTRF